MRTHWLGWLALTLLALLQPPGQIAADTKFDLTANPAGFLRNALHIYTDEFPLGQVQNQAYGYLFPQGPFFLLADWLHVPDWVAQRVWWALLLSIAYSGTLVLARRIGITATLPAVTAAVLYALSPRILTTLTAISSEAWPVALVPWTLVPLLGKRPNVAAAVVPVALMGGVNATATIAACVPAAVYLLAREKFRYLSWFTVGAMAVSAWWIGPLIMLGAYSSPFLDYIESATVTTAWLNPVEILRGTTSWAPFVETERRAGFLLVAEPTFIIATCLVAALGLAGLAKADFPQRRAFVSIFAVGFALLASAHFLIPEYDTLLAPFRNLHKFDPLVRLPLVLGVGWLLASMSRDSVKHAAPKTTAAILAATIAVAPAWSLRLLPQGTWDEVSEDWVAVGEWLDEHAAGTRTLVVPAAPFARQEWGWTRDEPIQALTNSRFVFRDAIPLVNPGAIRGLDGQVAVVDKQALLSIGVGAVVVRRDLEHQTPTPSLGKPTASFGDVDIFMLDAGRDMMITADEPLRAQVGGEGLPLLWRELGYFPVMLDRGGENPRHTIVTDTPALANRNYGNGAQSAHLATPDEDKSVHNPVKDYVSQSRRTKVHMEGEARASSSAADAGTFRTDAQKSLTAAFDGLEDTAWWPAPGDTDAYIEFAPETDTFSITATANTEVIISGDGPDRTVSLVGGQPRTLATNGARRITLTEPVGITEIDAGISRIVDVDRPGDAYFFQRIFPATEVLQRRFVTDVDAEWTLSAPARIDGRDVEGTVSLPAGHHELVTTAETIMLTHGPLDLPSWEPFAGQAQPADTDRIILTTRAFNQGLRASVGGTELEPLLIDAGAQAFRLPAGTSGEFTMWHEGDQLYRRTLFFGGAFSLLALAACVMLPRRRQERHETPTSTFAVLPLLAVPAANPVLGAAAAVLVWAVRRFTLIPSTWLAGGAMTFAGLWLARAPWPNPNYAGDTWLLALAGCLAVACLAFPESTNRAPGTSTNS